MKRTILLQLIVLLAALAPLHAAVFDVKTYGATGNGTTDDITAINSAISAAASAGGGTVLFPRGTYRTSAEIAVTSSNIHLAGEGIGASVIKCDLAVAKAIRFGFKGTTPGTSAGVANNSVSKLTVTRAAGTIPANSIGIAWDCFNYGSERDVFSERHYYPRSIDGGVDGTSISWSGINCYAANASRAYVLIKDAAGVSFWNADFGRNGGESVDPVYCVEISGGANEIHFTDASLIPRGPGINPTDVFGFTNLSNATGVFSLINITTESIRYPFTSDANTPVITELRIMGGRWATGSNVNFFNLNAATQLSNFSMSGGAGVNGPFNLTPYNWAKVTGCFFGGPVTLTGSGLTVTDCVFQGNTCNGDLILTGAWRKLRADPRSNVVLGSFVDTTTGDTEENKGALVKSVTNVSLTAVAGTNVFTVPAGKTFVCTGAYAVLTTVTGYNNAVAPAFFVDSGGGTAQLAQVGAIDPNVFNVLGRVAFMTPFRDGTGGVAAAGSTVRVYVYIANTSTALKATVFVTGFYY
jgi:hypothetical protein